MGKAERSERWMNDTEEGGKEGNHDPCEAENPTGPNQQKLVCPQEYSDLSV